MLAHVDGGKTTLTEAMLYQGGPLRSMGRVDHGDAFLDTHSQEKQRGITIYAKQAILSLPNSTVTLLDTPGHTDFSGEMERALSVLDYGILVIGGNEGVQGHTLTLWHLLERYGIPTFIFINKMDLAGANPVAILEDLQQRLDSKCVPFGNLDTLYEGGALCTEEALEEYLSLGKIQTTTLQNMITHRDIFPCYYGSALKVEGIDEFLQGLSTYITPKPCPKDFGAQVYKISRDPQGARLTHLKVTGGTLQVKDVLRGGGDDPWEEKVEAIRLYSGGKFQLVQQVPVGTLCTVTGLTQTKAGMALGSAPTAINAALAPLLTYRLNLPPQCDPFIAFSTLKVLEEEDPLLGLVWKGQSKEIHLNLMGDIQLDILTHEIGERFGWAVTFDQGEISYRETITTSAVGGGHFEPLRHYAEVQFLLEPLLTGSGIQVASLCTEEQLEGQWQKSILTYVLLHPPIGVLTGSPMTDLKITLTGGKTHIKHTEGGDMGEAIRRGLRQGLLQATPTLLEPWYQVSLTIPASAVGRGMSDIQSMGGTVENPEIMGETVTLTGKAPVSAMSGYTQIVASYTKGLGVLSLTPCGYLPCHNQDEVVERIGYDPHRDTDHPASSVFCYHGSSETVPWDKVWEHMHQPKYQPPKEEVYLPTPVPQPRQRKVLSSLDQDKELLAIFERTYGPIGGKAQGFDRPRRVKKEEFSSSHRSIPKQKSGPEYLLVDGYNIIFGWDDLKAVAQDNLDAARQLLLDILSNYQGYRQCEVIVVFDAYKVIGGTGSTSKYHNIHVVYTKEAETADTYIEKSCHQLAKDYRVRVATSDGVEQIIILGQGALRVSASTFQAEVRQTSQEISAHIAKDSQLPKNRAVAEAMERAKQKTP